MDIYRERDRCPQHAASSLSVLMRFSSAQIIHLLQANSYGDVSIMGRTFAVKVGRSRALPHGPFSIALVVLAADFFLENFLDNMVMVHWCFTYAVKCLMHFYIHSSLRINLPKRCSHVHSSSLPQKLFLMIDVILHYSPQVSSEKDACNLIMTKRTIFIHSILGCFNLLQ